MNYTKEQLMPKRYPENKPSEGGVGVTFWAYKSHHTNGWFDYCYPAHFPWDSRPITWFIDIPGAPEEVKPLAYPEHKPEREGTYFAYDSRNYWIEYIFNGKEFHSVDQYISYFINVRLEDLEKEDDTEETVVSVNMKNGKPTISNISAKKFHVEQLEKMGFDVQLIKREPEIAPCPNPECGAECTVILAAVPRFDDGTTDDYRYVHCPRCKYYGPRGNGRIEAIRLHNLICERK